MKKNSLTLLLTIGCTFIFEKAFNSHGEILSKYQFVLLYMLTYLMIRKILD